VSSVGVSLSSLPAAVSSCSCRHRWACCRAATRPNNTVKLPQSQVPHSLTHPSSFIVCLLHSHRQKNTRSTPPRPADHQSVPSRVQPPPQPTTTADHRSPPPPSSPAGKFDRLRFCVCIVGELLAVASCCGRTCWQYCWQYCVVSSEPTTPFEVNQSPIPRFTCVFVGLVVHRRTKLCSASPSHRTNEHIPTNTLAHTHTHSHSLLVVPFLFSRLTGNPFTPTPEPIRSRQLFEQPTSAVVSQGACVV
jgi:hypothetical protein